MIFRLSQKLAKKLKIPVPRPAPVDPNPFADWSGHLFTADRTQYLILTNTPSLYSTVIYGRGIANESQFLDRALSAIREFTEVGGQEFIFRRLIAPAAGTERFASALNPIASETVAAARAMECRIQLEAKLARVNPVIADEYDYSNHEKSIECTLEGIVCIEVRITRVHAHPSILMAGKQNRIDLDRWRPLIMSLEVDSDRSPWLGSW